VGSPRGSHGELLKLGIAIGQTSVAKYMERRRGPPSQGWRTFLRNHADGIAAMDLFVVPTISFRLLMVCSSGGMTGAGFCGWGPPRIQPRNGSPSSWSRPADGDLAPRYLVRDRDRSYGEVFVRRVRAMGIRDRRGKTDMRSGRLGRSGGSALIT
jgi:hypothetical protein